MGNAVCFAFLLIDGKTALKPATINPLALFMTKLTITITATALAEITQTSEQCRNRINLIHTQISTLFIVRPTTHGVQREKVYNYEVLVLT